ncbi:MAG: DVU0298 family protein [Desulfovibrionaceae bacterium]
MAKLRQLKLRLHDMLMREDWERELAAIEAMADKDAVGPLLSFLMRGGALKWRAVTALGLVAARIADERMEAGRVIMRQLMWYLNEESGTLGWGAPETMAEVMACHAGLADEFHSILLSYILDRDPGNFLDHAPLRRCAFWGVGRLAQARPRLAAKAAPELLAGLADADIPCRGMAAWALGIMAPHLDAASRAAARVALEPLLADPTEVDHFCDRRLLHPSVGDLAREALARIAG